MFSILSDARAWTSVILTGKRGSRRHFQEQDLAKMDVVVAETNYQRLDLKFYHFSIGSGLNLLQ